jgi:nitrite reductase (cytochrome c-552)
VAHDFHRKAQFFLDFVEAENSMGFHASQEAVRILGESINFSRKGQNALRPASAQQAASTNTDEQEIASSETVPASP